MAAAIIRIRDQQSPLQHVYVAAEAEGCELETLIGALHGNQMFRVEREHGMAKFIPMGASDSLAHAVAQFKAMCSAPVAAPLIDEAPEAIEECRGVAVADEAPPSE